MPFLEPIACFEGDKLFEAGTTAVGMYFVEKGTCICEQTAAKFAPGAGFAMECLFPPERARQRGLVHARTVTAQEELHVLALTRYNTHTLHTVYYAHGTHQVLIDCTVNRMYY